MKVIFITLISSISLLQACSTPPKPFPKSAENDCMVDVFNKIRIVRSNTPEQANESKESQCSRIADFNVRWDRVLTSDRKPSAVQNAAGQVVIQQSIVVNEGAKKSARDAYYKECMNDPKVRAFTAPPAYLQLEGMNYGFSSIGTQSCPTSFSTFMNEYVQGSQYVVDVMKRYPNINTAQQNEIVKRKVPRNPMEKDIIDASNSSRSAYIKMVYYFANATGWCPSDKGLYKCDPNNITFRN